MFSVISIYIETPEKKTEEAISENDNDLSRFLHTVMSYKDQKGNLILSEIESSLLHLEGEEDEAISSTKLNEAIEVYNVVRKLHIAIENKEIKDLDNTFRYPKHFYSSFETFYKTIKLAAERKAKVKIIDIHC